MIIEIVMNRKKNNQKLSTQSEDKIFELDESYKSAIISWFKLHFVKIISECKKRKRERERKAHTKNKHFFAIVQHWLLHCYHFVSFLCFFFVRFCILMFVNHRIKIRTNKKNDTKEEFVFFLCRKVYKNA